MRQDHLYLAFLVQKFASDRNLACKLLTIYDSFREHSELDEVSDFIVVMNRDAPRVGASFLKSFG